MSPVETRPPDQDTAVGNKQKKELDLSRSLMTDTFRVQFIWPGFLTTITVHIILLTLGTVNKEKRLPQSSLLDQVVL